MKLVGLLSVLVIAAGGAVATLQPNAQCMRSWSLIPGDYCAAGLACVSGGWGDGYCETHSCIVTLATSTSTVYAPTQTTRPASARTTVFTTITQGTFCNCPPNLIFTTTRSVRDPPLATLSYGSNCQPGRCETGLECVQHGTYQNCYIASCVDPGLPARTTTVTPTVTSAASTSTLTATATSRVYTHNPGDPVCSCTGGLPTTTITSYFVVDPSARAM